MKKGRRTVLAQPLGADTSLDMLRFFHIYEVQQIVSHFSAVSPCHSNALLLKDEAKYLYSLLFLAGHLLTRLIT